MMTPVTFVADWIDTLHGIIDSAILVALVASISAIVAFVERFFHLNNRAARAAYVIGAAVLGLISALVYRARAAEKLGALVARYFQ